MENCQIEDPRCSSCGHEECECEICEQCNELIADCVCAWCTVCDSDIVDCSCPDEDDNMLDRDEYDEREEVDF